MPITVVPQPTAGPPRFQITISTPNGEAMTAVAVSRTQNGATVPLRAQPVPGSSPIVLQDYEADWETITSFAATVTRAGVTETYASTGQTLSPLIPWLIHPTTPALSLPLDQRSFDVLGVTQIGDESRAALKTKHRILGSEFQVVTKVGPRAAPTLSMQIATVTAAERGGLMALLRDQTPILIRVPGSYGFDFDSGYYDVDDVSTSRLLQIAGETRRTVTLPIERVQAPAGTQQAVRTWAQVLAQNATWASVVAGYATWGDLLTDMRR